MEISLIADATMVKTLSCVDELGGTGGLGLTDVVGKGRTHGEGLLCMGGGGLLVLRTGAAGKGVAYGDKLLCIGGRRPLALKTGTAEKGMARGARLRGVAGRESFGGLRQ